MDSKARKFYIDDAFSKEIEGIDPRRKNSTRHSGALIMFVTLMGVLADCTTWTEMADYAKCHKGIIDDFFEGVEDTPSHDTLRRFFCIVDPRKIEALYRSWAGRLSSLIYLDSAGRHVAIDGKTIRGALSAKSLMREDPSLSQEKASRARLHMVSAFVAGQNVSLGQERVSHKHNELDAIRQLLECLTFEKGDVVTIDAMGTHADIAQAIIDAGADYLLFVKDNQKLLKRRIAETFDSWRDCRMERRVSRCTERSEGHGRVEVRQCWSCSETLALGERGRMWPSLRSYGRILTQRTEKTAGDTTEQVHYFISSLPHEAKEIIRHKRMHWQVENGLHWQLDVSFNEDSDRKRMNSAQNYSVINKMVLALLKSTPSKKSMIARRKWLSWNPEAMKEMMFKAISFFSTGA